MTASSWKEFEDYLVRTRYSVRDPETGEPLEASFEEMLDRRVLPALAVAMKTSPYLAEGGAKASCFPASILEAIRNRIIIPATPVLMSLGNPHTRRHGFFSCYPMGRVEDSLAGIDAMRDKMRRIYTSGGGVGIDVSGLRPKGALIDGGQGASSGPVAFLQDFDSVTGTTNQGGRRRGALLVQMDWEHPDIREFVQAKNFNSRLNRLIRTLPEDERPPQAGTLTNMNLSVNVYGKFWEDEGLVDLIARNMWETGDPGLLFVDNMIEHSPIRAEDEPRYSNPCGEYLSSAETACNLVTVNVARLAALSFELHHERQRDMEASFFKRVYEHARQACILGNVILDMDEGYPLDEIREKTQLMRPVGVGMSGFHTALLLMTACPPGMPTPEAYGSEKACKFAGEVQTALTLGTLRASARLTEITGKAYANSAYWNRHLDELQECQARFDARLFREPDPLARALGVPRATRAEAFRFFAECIDKHGGFYNCVTTSQPPTGSVSAFLHNLDTGIEPFFSVMAERRVRTPDGGWKTFVLEPESDVRRYFEGPDAHPTALDIDAESQLDMLGAFQRYCHTGISKTINLPSSATVEDVKRLVLKARDLRLKGFTVYRDGSLDQVITAHEPKKEAPPAPADALALAPAPALAPPLLDIERQAVIFRARGQSLNAHITLAHDEANNIREVFMAAGELGADVNAIYTAFGMVLSVALRHDPDLLEPLTKVLCKVNMDQRVIINTRMSDRPIVGNSLPQAVGMLMRMRKAYLDGAGPSPAEPKEPRDMVGDATPSPALSWEAGNMDLCPECHRLALRRDGSCRKCVNCGYSAC
ncbi:MAG: hypothetical protein LBR80_04195 [Deltaproteobacteria bacterium]|nr:hypothetical protein [Deltaproteobacteria bacterium]